MKVNEIHLRSAGLIFQKPRTVMSVTGLEPNVEVIFLTEAKQGEYDISLYLIEGTNDMLVIEHHGEFFSEESGYDLAYILHI